MKRTYVVNPNPIKRADWDKERSSRFAEKEDPIEEDESSSSSEIIPGRREAEERDYREYKEYLDKVKRQKEELPVVPPDEDQWNLVNFGWEELTLKELEILLEYRRKHPVEDEGKVTDKPNIIDYAWEDLTPEEMETLIEYKKNHEI